MKHASGYWLKIENQRAYLNSLYDRLQLKSFKEWQTVPRKTLIENGANSLLSVYKGNFQKVLKTIYPHENENIIQVRRPIGHWKSIENQRKYFDDLFVLFNLNSLDDWKRIPLKKLFDLKNGARSVILLHNGSFQKTLQTLYPEHKWDFTLTKKIKIFKRKIKRGHWNNIENQKEYLNSLYYQFKLTSMDDWFTLIPHKQLHSSLARILPRYQGNSRLALQTIYPNYPWNFNIKKKKEKGFWRVHNVQLKYMEKLFINLNLKSLDDWKKVTKEKFLLNDGLGILAFHRFNRKNLLKFVYPHHNWANFEKETKKINFKKVKFDLMLLQRSFNVQRKEDWYRIPQKKKKFFTFVINESNINNNNNNNNINDNSDELIDAENNDNNNNNNEEDEETKQFDFELFKILPKIYPDQNWSVTRSSFRSKKSTQRWLWICVNRFYSQHLILEDYHHPLLDTLTSTKFELDVYIPSINLAVEYQGEQHYDDLASGFSALELYMSRDSVKFDQCNQHEIPLLIIPYWWNRSPFSLLQTVQNFFISNLKLSNSNVDL